MPRLLATSLVLLSLIASLASAESASSSLNLIARTSLDGWNAGPVEPQGWAVKDGVLIGESKRSPITSAWTFGDFELTLTVRSGEALFSTNTTGTKGLAFTIQAAPGNKPRTYTISRVGDTLAYRYDGGKPTEGQWTIPAAARLELKIQEIHASPIEISELRVAEPVGQSIFNGRDLTGWRTLGKVESWPVIDGNLVCVNNNGNYLRSEKEYGNFILSLDYKIKVRGNSGIGIRTPRDSWPSGDGMELQIEDRPRDEKHHYQSFMAIYGNVEPIDRNDRSDEWNHVVVRAEGYMISAWVNGQLVQQVNTWWMPELKHRHLKGWIGFQDHGARIEFKNIHVLELPDGRGPDAWYAPRPRWGSEIVANRLMNLEEAARNDAGALKTVRASAGGKGEQTVAELKGPGAVLAVVTAATAGKVKMYFNTESTPRVDAPADQLTDALPNYVNDKPAYTNNKYPLLTYVPFKTSLRVTVTDAPVADWALEYVNFDPTTKIEPFEGPVDTMRRGTRSPLMYRAGQHSHGTIRSEAPYPTASSDKHTVDAGATVPLARLDGSGIVQYIKLACPNKSLQNDELWLEVTVNGESTPAVSAPVRYWFPGLDKGNYHNFVVGSRNGYFNRLAMPYSQGISFAVLNRGKKPVKDVSLTVSYAPATADEVAQYGVLRGLVYGTEYKTKPATMAFSSSLVGIVAAAPKGGKLGYEPSLLDLPAGDAEMRQALNGRASGLSWRWWLLGRPADLMNINFSEQRNKPGAGCLLLYYADAPAK